MIFGITLKRFAKLLSQGDKAKESKRTVRLLNKEQVNAGFKTRSLEDLKFSDFVNLEIYLQEQNFYEFCRIFVNKHFWQTIYVHHTAAIIEDYTTQLNALYEKNYYIFDPPQYGMPGEVTLGSQLKTDFVEEFGNWVVLIDVVCKGHLKDFKEVEKWKVGEFMFWSNYLTGQRIIEGVK